MVLKVRAYPFFQLKAHSEISFDAPKKPSNLLYVLALMCTIGWYKIRKKLNKDFYILVTVSTFNHKMGKRLYFEKLPRYLIHLPTSTNSDQAIVQYTCWNLRTLICIWNTELEAPCQILWRHLLLVKTYSIGSFKDLLSCFTIHMVEKCPVSSKVNKKHSV